ncbi:hypothetical protein RD792_005014 [Penstemon davidsonii]|uniref:Glabrous enhancer-binding protein-like DBD domain-containing protein n=1 Tax=Penstemon davidsonii TaxID=160366 RepID=A0ABR0DJ14_9LAMI|nr:hypothetical protein RD792_005014 [Penstemon davidsonii]
MAKNREPVKPLGPESDHSEEEEEDDSEESDSESESEPESILAKKPSASAPLKSLPQPLVSSSSEEDEDDSDSDAEGPNPNVKPIASKPMDDPQKPGKKPQSKTIVSEPATASKSSGKRPTEEKEDEGKDSKRSKKNPEPENDLGAASDSSKKVHIQRIWSEEDEIVILKGMLDYTAKKKSNPVADPDAFLDYIKKNLHIEVSKNQLQDKIRRLKKKYETSKSKGRNFSKPHEMEMFVLSENIWGKNEKGKETVAASPKANGSVVKKTAIKNANVVENHEEGDDEMSEEVANVVAAEKVLAPLKACINASGIDERVLMIGAELFEGLNGVKGSKEWKNLVVEEIDIHLKKLDMMRARTKLVLDYLKSNNQ